MKRLGVKSRTPFTSGFVDDDSRFAMAQLIKFKKMSRLLYAGFFLEGVEDKADSVTIQINI